MNVYAPTSAADLFEHYKAVRRRMWGRDKAFPKVLTASLKTKPVKVTPPVKAVEPAPESKGPVKGITYTTEVRPVPEISYRLEHIAEAVSKAAMIGLIELKSERRFKNAVLARHIIFYLGRKYTLLSLPRMGQLIGKRDHSTVLHGIRRIEDLLNAFDAKTVTLVAKAEHILRSNAPPRVHSPEAAGQEEEGLPPAPLSSSAFIQEEAA